jgi:hypothetical protein
MSINRFEIAGLVIELINEEGEFTLNPATNLTLPVSLVCGLSAVSYSFADCRQAVLDALSPFQIASKIWSSQAAQNVMQFPGAQEERSIVFVGSWFGQQSAMMARSATHYMEWNITLVDKDPIAHEVAKTLLSKDSYHRRCSPDLVNDNIFNMAFDPGTVFVWNGLEHFEYMDVGDFLTRHSDCAFVFQSTSMPATDHINLAQDLDDLLKVIPSDWDEKILYRGELSTNLGSRYMMVVAGPGFDTSSPQKDEDVFDV